MYQKNSQNKPKILVVTPRFPYPEAGACEQDRADGLRQLGRLGFEVEVIGKVFDWQDKSKIVVFWKKEGVPVSLVFYKYQRLNLIDKLKILVKHPLCLDASALEYTEPEIVKLLEAKLDSFKPDIVWFDYTYLWPLYKMVQSRRIPIVTRSINFEPKHFLEENGYKFINYIKYLPKWFSEKITVNRSDLLLSITPKEQGVYVGLGAKQVVNMPLRSLAYKVSTHKPRAVEKLHVFFSGSTYNVSHNRKALEFLIRDLAPQMFRKNKNFIFHITGSKFPEDLKDYLVDNVVYDGFVENMSLFLEDMDIALIPSLFGAGMQQKIFEPLARGFPTITHKRGLVGYDFIPNQDLLVAESPEDFVGQLEKLVSFDKRVELSKNSIIKSKKQFSQAKIDNDLSQALKELLV